ncbi:hypothetical protein MHYP_G00113740 [Metynnis hypsauchen]
MDCIEQVSYSAQSCIQEKEMCAWRSCQQFRDADRGFAKHLRLIFRGALAKMELYPGNASPPKEVGMYTPPCLHPLPAS